MAASAHKPIPAESPAKKSAGRKTTGLRYWMEQVLEECEKVSADFSADPVHDLRVALRRCRSMADGMRALDPNPDWKAMKKAGKALFQSLGDLRDVQIMMEWIEKLEISGADATAESGDRRTSDGASPDHANAPESAGPHAFGDPAGEALLKILESREREQKLEARAALEKFDRKQWRNWSKSLPARAARFRPGRALFKHIALERWTEARQLHARALRNRSQIALHSLRIGIKRFRYIVENFLPLEHRAWSNDLKAIQDLLGDVHDLDVLWSTAVSCHVFADVDERNRWHRRILAERNRRIEKYRAKMLGPDSLWQVWRAALPQGKQIEALATRRMKLWAGGLDPDFPHSERVAQLALQFYDGLLSTGWQPAVDGSAARSSLLAAALLHDVGKSEGDKGHHKASFDLIREHGTPLGWRPEELQRAALVARFHRGALPRRNHKSLRDLMPDEQKSVIQLAAILRLANAFDASHDGQIRRIQIENDAIGNGIGNAVAKNRRSRQTMSHRLECNRLRLLPKEALIVGAEGYAPLGPSAQVIAGERHLLETVLRRAILIRAMKPGLKR